MRRVSIFYRNSFEVVCTQILFLIALDRRVPGSVEIVESDVRMGNLHISLSYPISYERTITQNTYPDMIIQVVANREVDPLLGVDHCRTIHLRVLDDVELVFRPNTTWIVSEEYSIFIIQLTSKEELRRAKSACGDYHTACLSCHIDCARVSGTDTAALGALQLDACNVATSSDQPPSIRVCPHSEFWSRGRRLKICAQGTVALTILDEEGGIGVSEILLV